MYRNRIVETKLMSPQELKANPKNWRKHPKAQAEGLDGVLTEIGWVQNVILNRTTGHLIDGHLRIELAIRNRESQVPVTVVELSQEEEDTVLATIDPITTMAKVNHEALAALIAGITTTSPAVADLIDRIKKNSCIQQYGKDDTVVNEGNTHVKQGDIFKLGDHRLMCGSSADKDNLATLLQDRKVDLLVTDPPYGVDYGSVEEMRHQTTQYSKIREGIIGDKNVDEARVVWDYSFQNIVRYMKEGAVAYVFSPQGENFYALSKSIMDAGIDIHQQIVWNKDRFVFGRSDYKYKHEVIIYGWTKGVHKWNGAGNENSVWECEAPTKSELHPTQKPVALYERAILNSSDVGDVVVDLFGGSGTCIAACEMKGRQCCTMELSPVFCQSIINRWEMLSGTTAIKE